MKKFLIVLAILPLLIVSCSSDDDVTTTTTDFDHNIQLLYGEWRATGVEVSGVPIDLTPPKMELLVAPTYVAFGEDGSFISTGVLGEGTGTYGTKDKTIYTSIGKDKVNFEMTSLKTTTAKIKLDSKVLGIPIIPENTGMVTVILTKNYPRTIDFDYDIKMLYGKWRATRLEGEGVPNTPIDLTNPFAKATYITFDKNGVLLTEGYLGNGKGRYATKDKLIVTAVDGEVVSFEMLELNEATAKIEIDAKALGLPMIPEEIEEVQVVLTKQLKEAK